MDLLNGFDLAQALQLLWLLDPWIFYVPVGCPTRFVVFVVLGTTKGFHHPAAPAASVTPAPIAAPPAPAASAPPPPPESSDEEMEVRSKPSV